MPNGRDKNLWRLAAACAGYRRRFAEWPAEAWMEPAILHDVAHVLDGDRFTELASRIRLKTKDQGGISVGGARGVEVYDGSQGDLDGELLDLARTWLGVFGSP